MFTKAICAHFDRESHFLGKLTMKFEQLAIWTKGLSDEFYLECFISGLKEAIRDHVSMHHPTTQLQAC
jgi:hypothetical protein